MTKYELVMPKMGESIIEATILKWVKNVGDTVEIDETILEIATDKVDSEVPSPVNGVIEEIRFQEDDIVEIGKVIAIIKTEVEIEEDDNEILPHEGTAAQDEEPELVVEGAAVPISVGTSKRFYSPLVKKIAEKENISPSELEGINGTGAKGRVTKSDILAYLKERPKSPKMAKFTPSIKQEVSSTSINGQDEIIQMDRMRKLIADHMVHSVQTSPHVTSFVEVDVTEIVNWRNRIKKSFLNQYGEKITFTPIFIEAVVQAIKDFPMVNISVDGDRIIKKKNINIGMATALPNGNLIVPVIKNADSLNLLGITKTVNDLANRARNNTLKPNEIQEGTFTITNVGTFGNVMGTPIINQPQVAILAIGAIRKKPAVVETAYGDLIAIRHMMFLSLSYDHRVVDGFLGGSFLRRIGDYLEAFDPEKGV